MVSSFRLIATIHAFLVHSFFVRVKKVFPELFLLELLQYLSNLSFYQMMNFEKLYIQQNRLVNIPAGHCFDDFS